MDRIIKDLFMDLFGAATIYVNIPSQSFFHDSLENYNIKNVKGQLTLNFMCLISKLKFLARSAEAISLKGHFCGLCIVIKFISGSLVSINPKTHF